MTPLRSRRGFTLTEILIALVLLGMVSTVIYKMLITTQRVTDAQAQRGDLQTNLRSAVLVIPNELRQVTVSTTSGSLDSITDIRAISDTSITYRAMRGFYVICSTPTSATSLKVVNASGFSSEYRTPTTSDSAFVFWDGDTTKTSDDAWVQVGIAGVATTTCTYAGASRSAYTFTFAGSGIPSGFAYAKVYGGSPVRTYETVTLSLYASGGQEWLGMQVGSGTMQPVVGPLAATSGGLYGFQLTPYDSTGSALTASASNIQKIRTIKIALRGVTSGNVSEAGSSSRAQIKDSLVTYVTLRNAPLN
jgi:prepilin-type N-terminal cleavage/methylation domain-containing protein